MMSSTLSSPTKAEFPKRIPISTPHCGALFEIGVNRGVRSELLLDRLDFEECGSVLDESKEGALAKSDPVRKIVVTSNTDVILKST